MFETAVRLGEGQIEGVIGLAGLGRTDDAKAALSALADVSPADRIRLARTVAPSDVAWALDLLPDNQPLARAACLHALGQGEAAAVLVRDLTGREADVLHAAIASGLGNNRTARQRLNGIFGRDGLALPVDAASGEPLALSAFGGEANPMDGPLTSVVVAARNAADTIEVAVRSLLAQSWHNLEIIVVDDGSSDDTVARLRSLSASDDRLRVIANSRTPGAYGARNTGIEAAMGAFIAFHDADDWAHPQRIERQISALRPDQSASVCRHLRIDGAGRIVSPRVFPLSRINPILTLVRREVLDRLGGFEEVRLGADSELLARLDAVLGRGAVARLPEVLVMAGWSSRSLMGGAVTGLSPEGLKLRVAYVEAWRHRHALGDFRPAR